MELTEIIKKPIQTEKTNLLQANNNVVTFEVNWYANKFQVAKAVEFIFKVKVEKVNLIKVDKKPKRVGRFNGFTNRYKKAYVFLKEGEKINFYPEETKKKETKKKDTAKTEEQKAKEKSVEEKVAAKLAKTKAEKPAAPKASTAKKVEEKPKKVTTTKASTTKTTKTKKEE
ncbi:50S ribosomal protein L23 [Mycoplasmopsis hyopharyngis]|uniref:50S ribosomal protein L23 n=1 Tax=Mycoplasmopsis hyopharyngis TaxID=29558 RepID=UPI0038733AF5